MTLGTADDGSSRPSGLEERLADRVRDDLSRAESLERARGPFSVSSGDFHVLSTHWDLTQPIPELAGQRTSGVIGWVRRLLWKLLFPSYTHQSEFTAATSRVLLDVTHHVANIERALGELEGGSPIVTPGRDADPEPRINMLELENRFRGTEDEIRERQRSYADRFAGSAPVLDIGCGRGEFLTLMAERGVTAAGVDSDPAMVAHCLDQGLDVVCARADVHLSGLRESSLGGIFCAQVIEHMPPADVVRFMELAASRLRPSGLFLLESPNPESFYALAGFYLDFTHVRPYHPLAIAWFMEQLGFDDVSIEYSSPVHPSATDAPASSPPLDLDRAAAIEHAILGPRSYAAIGAKTMHSDPER